MYLMHRSVITSAFTSGNNENQTQHLQVNNFSGGGTEKIALYSGKGLR